MKKYAALALTLLLVLSLALAGCAGDSPSSSTPSAVDSSDAGASQPVSEPTTSGEEVTITFWTLTDKSASAEYAAEAFMAANQNIKVDLVLNSIDTHKQNLKVAASSRTLPSLWFNWGGNLASFYTANGLTYDLTDYAAANGWSDKFQSAVMSLCTLEGQLAGYPLSLNMLGLFYNKAIFEQYDIAIPTTLEELEAAADTLVANGVIPFNTGGKFGWHVMRYLEQLIEYYGGEAAHDELQAMSASWGESDAVNQAFVKYKEWVDKGYFPEGFVSADPNDARMALYSGQAAMQLEGQWFDGGMINDEQDPSDYGCFPFPSKSDNGRGRMSAFAEMFQFSADLTDAELEAAIMFADFYTSQEVVDAATGDFNLPQPIYGATIPEIMVNVPSMVEDMDVLGTFTITDQAFPTEVADVLFAAQDAVALGSMEPSAAGASVQEAIDAYKAANG